METKEVKETVASENETSRSKKKREERQKKQKAQKRSNLVVNIVVIGVAVLVVAGIAWLVTSKVIANSKKVVASDAFGEELEDNGFVKGVTSSDYITLCDYKNITVPASVVEYTDEQMEADITEALENHTELNTESGTVEDGDKINVDYVGSIDGVEFEGGNSNGQGSDLTIGSHQFIDDFEEQLIGYKVGEVVNVNVDFPEDYATADLAGKNADFVVTINGKYDLPELTDEFVATSLKAYATTVDGYKQYLTDKHYNEQLDEYLKNYLKENSTLSKYPKSYLKNLKSTIRYADEQSYQYMNQMYMSYYGQGYGSFEEYTGKTEEEYLVDLTERSEDACKTMLINQGILEAEGITLTEDVIKDDLLEQYGSEEAYKSIAEQYGMGYLANGLVEQKALEVVKGYTKIQ